MHNGGAIYALGTRIELNIHQSLLKLVSNSAKNGGAMYMSAVASLTLPTGSRLYTANNSATEYGGALYIQDNPTILQCSFTVKGKSREMLEISFFPYHTAFSAILSEKEIKYVLNMILPIRMETFSMEGC